MYPPTIGDSRTYEVTFTDGVPVTGVFPDGTPKDPTTIKFYVQDGKGNLTIFQFGIGPDVVKVSTGVYLLVVTFATFGTYVIRAEGTGQVAAAFEWRRTVEASGINSLN